MQLSVIIPTLNEAEQIADAVDSSMALQPYQVIVADGGSSDSTTEVAQKTGATVIAASPGRGLQQNAGAERARGELLLFLHADCRLPSDARSQLKQAFLNQDVHFAAFDQHIPARGWTYRMVERAAALRTRWGGICYGDQGIAIRAESLKSVGGFPEVRLMEDVILSRRLRQKLQTRPRLLPGPITVSPRRWEQHGIIRQTLRNQLLLFGEKIGIPPDRLANWYRPHRAD